MKPKNARFSEKFSKKMKKPTITVGYQLVALHNMHIQNIHVFFGFLHKFVYYCNIFVPIGTNKKGPIGGNY